MKTIELPRRGGKTTKLLEWLKEHGPGGLLVVSGYDMENVTWRLAERLELTEKRSPEGQIVREGIQRRQITSYYGIKTGGNLLGHPSAVAIDDAERVLYDVFHAPVELLAWTTDDEMVRADVKFHLEPVQGDFTETDEKVEPL